MTRQKFWRLGCSAESLFEIGASHLGRGDEELGRALVEGSIIALHDSWARFCRNVVIISAIGGVIDGSGNKIPKSQYSNEADVLNAIRLYYNKRSSDWEPKWHDPGACLAAARGLGVGNLSRLNGAIGATPSPIDDIRKVRNFFAHKVPDAARKALTVSGGLAPHLYPCQRIGVNWTQFDRWLHQLRSQADAAI